MTLTPVTVEEFKGLRLLPEQGEAAGAVSMLNADFTRGPTQVGTRGGLARLVTGFATYHRISGGYDDDVLLAYRVSGSNVHVDSYSISTATSLNHTANWAATRGTSVVRVSDAVYIATRNGTANGVGQKWDSVGATPLVYRPRYFAYTADDRLAAAHYTTGGTSPTGADGSKQAVFFSDAGDATTFPATNWVQLSPDDGEEITGMVAWRDSLFVIKRSSLFVFYGTSVDATGNPIFNFRRLDLPSRARVTTNAGGENIIAGGDGVYLLLQDGVYRTTGDVPQPVSTDISPLFDGTGDSTMLFPASGDWSIGFAQNRLYLSYQVGSTYRTLVYDARLGEWLLWDTSGGTSSVPTNVVEWINANSTPTAYFAAGSKLFSLTETATSDDGTAIASHYQLGFDPLGYASQEKKIRSVAVVGTGSPTVDVFTDYATSDPLSRSGTVTLGTSPVVAAATHMKAYRGQLFSCRLSATSGLWTVARVTWNVQTVRAPGMRSS